MINGVIRVAQVIGPALNGGTEAFVMNYYKNVDHSKVEFDFLVENESRIVNKSQLCKYGNGQIIIIPSYKKPFSYIKELTRIFKDGKYDIVHSNMNALSFLTLKAAKNANIKVRIAHSHSTSSHGEILRNIAKGILKTQSLRYPTHLCACSKDAGIWLFGNEAYNNGKITIIPNAIELSSFEFDYDARLRIRSELKIKKTDFVVGTVGRLVTQKNPLFTLDVFRQYLKFNSNAVLLFVGEGPMYGKIVAKAKAYGIFDKVILAGAHEHIQDYYDAMDVFLFPSIYEGLGISMVEAQATGLPCICSEQVPLEAIVLSSSKVCSLSDKPIKWASCINDLPKLDRTQQSWLFDNKCFNIANEAKKMVSMYQSLLNN